MPLEKIVKSAVKTDRKTRAEPRKENETIYAELRGRHADLTQKLASSGLSMKIVIGATGASGSIYLQRLLEQINASEHEVHLVMTVHARQVADHELHDLSPSSKVLQHPDDDMNVPFVSGSARFDAMVIVPCSMSTLGRIATGSGQGALLRAADVF